MLTRATLALFALLLPTPAQDKVEFGPRFKAGEVARYRFVQASTQSMEGGMMAGQETEMEMVIDLRRETTAVGEEGIDQKLTIERMRMRSELPMFGEVIADSADPVEEDDEGMLAVIGKVVRALSGQTLSVHLSSDGRVESVKGADEVMRKLVESLEDDPMASAMFEGMGDQFGDSSVRQWLDPMTESLPRKPVAVEETWTAEWEDKLPGMGGSLAVRSENRLVKVEKGEGGADRGTIESDLRFTTKSPMRMEQAGFAMEITLEEAAGHHAGIVDVGTGLLRSLEGEVTMRLKMKMDLGAGENEMAKEMAEAMGNMSVRQRIRQTIALVEGEWPPIGEKASPPAKKN
jgi:hypothetical protein